MSAPFTIRDARFPDDRATAVAFIDALQHFERTVEPNRRIDDKVGAEYFDELFKRIGENKGRVFIAEDGARILGWSVYVQDDLSLYVEPQERRVGYVAELFVIEAARGRGVGTALIQACEDEARAQGMPALMIGVLARNENAARRYLAAGFSPYALQLRKYL